MFVYNQGQLVDGCPQTITVKAGHAQVKLTEALPVHTNKGAPLPIKVRTSQCYVCLVGCVLRSSWVRFMTISWTLGITLDHGKITSTYLMNILFWSICHFSNAGTQIFQSRNFISIFVTLAWLWLRNSDNRKTASTIHRHTWLYNRKTRVCMYQT